MKALVPAEVAVDTDGAGNSGRDEVMAISRSTTEVWLVSSVKKTFISVHSKWFGIHVTEEQECISNFYIAEILENEDIVGLKSSWMTLEFVLV